MILLENFGEAPQTIILEPKKAKFSSTCASLRLTVQITEVKIKFLSEPRSNKKIEIVLSRQESESLEDKTTGTPLMLFSARELNFQLIRFHGGQNSLELLLGEMKISDLRPNSPWHKNRQILFDLCRN